jgi:hypothetical protein
MEAPTAMSEHLSNAKEWGESEKQKIKIRNLETLALQRMKR